MKKVRIHWSEEESVTFRTGETTEAMGGRRISDINVRENGQIVIDFEDGSKKIIGGVQYSFVEEK